MIASKYAKYKSLTQITSNHTDEDLLSSLAIDGRIAEKIDESSKIFNEIGIKRYCCKRHLLTHVDLIEKI
tara:strand:- start:25 stop:234 length:210 start_codon:yes stop_codon:yes gene_type:complete